jgi:peptide/nickel transport system substrate-binding protein
MNAKIIVIFITALVFAFVSIPSIGLSAELKIGIKAEPSSTDPHFYVFSPNLMIAAYTFDRLVNQDANMNMKAGLAVSWKPVDDLTWEFKLREGVKWHDGSPFSAEDVEFSLKRAPNVPKSPSSFGRFVKQIKSIQIIDPLTIHLKTGKPFPLMPAYLSVVPIVSKKNGEGANTKDYNTGKAMIGTGPFKFVEWVPGDRMVFERNDSYWGKKVAWEKITFKPISNDAARVAAMLAGDVDLIDLVPTSDINRFEKDPNISVIQIVSNMMIYLHMDSNRDISPFVTDKNGNPMKKNPLKDTRVRKAISKTINREAIVDRLMLGAAVPSSQIMTEGGFAFSEKLKSEKYDPDGAKALLAEAGWEGGFGLTIHGPNDRYVNDAKICQAIAQMLSRIGIMTKVETMPKNVFFPRGSKLEFSFLMAGWNPNTGEPSTVLTGLLHTYDKAIGFGGANRGRFSNAEFDKTLEKALVTVNTKEHEKLLIKATEIAIENYGIIPLHHQMNTWAMRKGLTYEARVNGYTLAQFVYPAK